MVASLPLCMEAPVNSSSSLDLHGAVQYFHSHRHFARAPPGSPAASRFSSIGLCAHLTKH